MHKMPNRYPGFAVAMYGAPSPVLEPADPGLTPWEDFQINPPTSAAGNPLDGFKLVKSEEAPTPRRLRCVSRVEEDGTLKLKVYLNDVLLFEAQADSAHTVSVETTV